jgi:hypothetical protein
MLVNSGAVAANATLVRDGTVVSAGRVIVAAEM